MNTYKIDLKVLPADAKLFQFDIDDAFFTSLDEAEIAGGQLAVRLEIKPTSGAFNLCFNIKGAVKVVCDRCLDSLTFPIVTENTLKVKFGAEFEDLDDLVTIPEEDGVIDVAWHIYEFINLALPIKRVHKEGECNEEMMQKLQEYLTVDTDHEEENEEL
ncbi:MAG: DUF177 domain-containing protein [Bacteroidaceae bacterium]